MTGTVEALGAIHFASAEQRSGAKGVKPEQLYVELVRTPFLLSAVCCLLLIVNCPWSTCLLFTVCFLLSDVCRSENGAKGIELL
jgi:hypothetical protein